MARPASAPLAGAALGSAAPPRAPRRRGVVGPLLLLGAGLVLLLNNVGVLPWSVWRDAWPYWPLLLVLLGLESFVTGRVSWGGLAIAVLVVALAGAIAAMSGLGDHWRAATAPSGPPTATVRQPADGATRATVRLGYGAGVLTVAALDEPGLLAAGELYGHRAAGLDARYGVANGVGSLRLAPGEPGEGGAFGRLDLRLARDLPLDLRLEIGAADATLDLRDLRLASLRLEAGASHVALTLPERGRPDVRIDGGAANVEVVVPAGMEARIVPSESPSVLEIDEARFRRVGDEYRTASFDGAEHRATITIDVGASRVRVQ